MKKTLLFTLLFTLILPVLAHAQDKGKYENYKDQTAKVQFDAPKTWKAEVEKDSSDILILTSPDEAVELMFWVMKAKDVEAALELLEEEIGDEIKNIKPDGEPEEITLNGMKGVTADATGVYEGKKVHLGVIILKTKNGKILLGMGIAESSKLAKHEAAVEKILASIRPF